jgi:hypothetical protein
MLDAVRPLYDFNDASLKPWTLTATYQIYDESGKPSGQGKYEYSWSAPNVYRIKWTRPGASRTEWHTAGGNAFYQATGDRLFYLEHELPSLLFSPIPDKEKVDPANVIIEKDSLQAGKIKLPCLDIRARMRPDHRTPVLPDSPNESLCFDPSVPVLRVDDTPCIAHSRLTDKENAACLSRLCQGDAHLGNGHSRWHDWYRWTGLRHPRNFNSGVDPD